ncbi:hypothetical protein DPMN_025281 [Dreissena polymorpha]|uniref:Uncharacterized protein n=1 Tax=Dreissena polymorpha TaxID=45954 RepID=A0A9D4LQI8_DREPO|nr:hypothetical protein DPMN_025281 [Dreissena polymorpha]
MAEGKFADIKNISLNWDPCRIPVYSLNFATRLGNRRGWGEVTGLGGTNGPTDQQTGQKQYVPHYYSGIHNKLGGGGIMWGGNNGGIMWGGYNVGVMRGGYDMFKKNVGMGGNNCGWGGVIMWGGIKWGGWVRGGYNMFKKIGVRGGYNGVWEGGGVKGV